MYGEYWSKVRCERRQRMGMLFDCVQSIETFFECGLNKVLFRMQNDDIMQSLLQHQQGCAAYNRHAHAC